MVGSSSKSKKKKKKNKELDNILVHPLVAQCLTYYIFFSPLLKGLENKKRRSNTIMKINQVINIHII